MLGSCVVLLQVVLEAAIIRNNSTPNLFLKKQLFIIRNLIIPTIKCQLARPTAGLPLSGRIPTAASEDPEIRKAEERELRLGYPVRSEGEVLQALRQVIHQSMDSEAK